MSETGTFLQLKSDRTDHIAGHSEAQWHLWPSSKQTFDRQLGGDAETDTN